MSTTVADWRKLRKAEKYRWIGEDYGLLSRIARDVGKDPSHVNRVFWGIIKRSPVIVDALNAAYAKYAASKEQQTTAA